MAAVATDVSLGKVVDGFVLTLRSEGKSPKTVEFHGGNLRRLIWFAGHSGWPEDIRQIGQWRVKEFLVYVAESTDRWGLQGNGAESSRPRASYNTTWHYYVSLRVFFGWAVKEGFLDKSPVDGVKLKRPSPPVVEPYTPAQIQSLLKVCDWDYEHNARFLASRNRAIVLTLLDTGLRLGELVGIRMQDIDRDRGLITVVGKGRKERVVRVGQVCQKALWRYLIQRGEASSPSLWLTEERRRLTGKAVQDMMRRLRKRAGLGEVQGLVHKFRHTFALQFLRADRNTFNLQHLLGHSTLEMTKRYVQTLGMQDALDAHVKASPVDGLGLKG
jgi:site-specific recombinase XerD